MGRVTKLQTSFNSGVLDPRLASRSDIKQFYQSVAVGTNIKTLPQGGLKRREGMAFVADIGSSARLVEFAFNVTQTYLLVFTNNNIAVYKDDVFQVNVATTITSAQAQEMNWTQSADTLIIVHEAHPPQRLVRGLSDTSWSLTDIPLTNLPQYNFGDYLSPSAVSEIQDIEFLGTWNNGDTYTLTLEGQTTSVITYDSVDATTSSRIQTALRALSNTSASGITVTIHAPKHHRATFGGNDSGKNWDSISPVVVSGAGTFNLIVDVNGSAAAEDSISATRGWPKTATFFESRLVFGGSTQKPQSLWLSKTNDFYNFDEGTGLADEGVFITLDTDQVNAINGLYAGRHLQVLTTGGEFYVPTAPITPATFTIKRQTQFGSIGLRPVSIDGSTLFIDRYGKSARELLYTYVEEAYNADSVSVMAPHLLNTPVDMAAQRGTATDESNYVYIVNTDGTMAVLNSLRSQEVTAWTKWETSGTIENIAVVVGVVYFLVKRTINSVTKYYLEKADENTFTDSNIRQTITPSVTVTGLGHLNGEVCRVKADGAVLADNTPSGGSITAERSVTDVEVGLNFNPTITTMPLNMDFQTGPTLTGDKRIVRVKVNMYESLGLYINDILLPTRKFGSGLLDTTPEPYTGLKEQFLLGWTELAQVTITQKDPLPMTLLSLAVEVEASNG